MNAACFTVWRFNVGGRAWKGGWKGGEACPPLHRVLFCNAKQGMLGRTDWSEWRTHRIYGMLTDWENGKERERERVKRQTLPDEEKEVVRLRGGGERGGRKKG